MNIKSPEISVIIPLYEEFRWLTEALASLVASHFGNWEAILVNDGSPVDPKFLVEPWLKDPRFHYLQVEHGGSAAARNAGLKSARAEWVAFLDQDDCLYRDHFDRQLEIARTLGPEFACIYSDYQRIDREGRVIDQYVSREVAKDQFVLHALSDRGLVGLGTALFRKSWIDQAGGFDPELAGYEETDLVVRLSLNGARFKYVPGIVQQWRNHPSNTMKSAAFQEERRLRFLSKLGKLAGQYPALNDVFPEFQARSWYKIGLYHAEVKEWPAAREWCWRAWNADKRHMPSLYLAVKASIRAKLAEVSLR